MLSRGRLYVTDYRAIFFDRYYAPSRVMPLLETLRRHPNLPDVDIVVAPNDEPRVKTLVDRKFWTRLCSRFPGGDELPPAMFARIVEPRVLPLLDDSSTCLFGSEGGVNPHTSDSNGKTMPSLPVSWEGSGAKGLTAPDRRACSIWSCWYSRAKMYKHKKSNCSQFKI